MTTCSGGDHVLVRPDEKLTRTESVVMVVFSSLNARCLKVSFPSPRSRYYLFRVSGGVIVLWVPALIPLGLIRVLCFRLIYMTRSNTRVRGDKSAGIALVFVRGGSLAVLERSNVGRLFG